MKTTVFGATGFIGSHVAEQLHLSGHKVTAVVKKHSDISFLESLGVRIQYVNFNVKQKFARVIHEKSIVYNCIAFGKTTEKKRILGR